MMGYFAMAVAALVIGFLLWKAFRPGDTVEPGPENNWKNADFASRERVGNWAEGSTHPKNDSGTGGILL